MSVGEIAQITAAFVVVLAPLNRLVDNCSGLADCLSSANSVAKRSASECEGA
jgi:vitamin B12/bleomycin/antimicrobial peptide transport system ATP-binding/permease protein